MPDFTWMEAEQRLSAAALTVRAQAVNPLDRGQMLWATFMPRRNVDATKLSTLTTPDVRISADRREWNARGRYINLVTPPRAEIEWIPVESYFTIEEKEINDLLNEVRGNQALFREIVGARIPDRVETLAMANWRRVELDVFEAWTQGQITSMNPQTGQTFVADYGFDTGRYQTAGTAWNDSGVNAYDELLAWLQEAFETIGPIEGIMLRLATRNAIVADAPNPMPGAVTGLTATVAQTEARIQDETGRPFRFFVNENTLETYTDAGITRQSVKVWPAQTVAAIPAGFAVGTTAFAPVSRAYDLTAQVPDAGIDIRGVTVFHGTAGLGRELTIEAQFNPMPDPDEQRIYVINVGV